MCTQLFLLVLIFLIEHGTVEAKTGLPSGTISSMRFLISVNDTWAGPGGCLATVATPPLQPDKKYNESEIIQVGTCDHGPMTFTVSKASGSNSQFTVNPTFYSSVIEDASPPTCEISWNATYRIPTTQDPRESLLPGCFTMESREGYHMTSYWIHILSWQFD